MFPYIYIILPSYGLFAFLGTFSTMMFCYFRLNRLQMEFRDFLIALLYASVGVFIGSRLLFTIVDLKHILEYTSLLERFYRLVSGGFVFYGGLLGAIAGLIFFTHRHITYNAIFLLEFAAPAFPLFHAFGRIGCFAAGCCYGIPLSKPFSLFYIQFDRVPVQLFEAVAEGVLFLLLLFLEHRHKNNLLKTYLLSYACFRFCIEFLRGDEARGILFGFSTAQWISIAIILYHLFLWLHQKSVFRGFSHM